MSGGSDILGQLGRLVGTVRASGPVNQDGIVRIGQALEAAGNALPASVAAASLKALQALYEGKCGRGEEALTQIEAALSAAAADDAAGVEKALAGLDEVLSSPAPDAAPPATPLQILGLDQVAALLIGLDAKDADGLKTVSNSLAAYASDPAHAAAACQHVKLALGHVEQANRPDAQPQQHLDQAAEAVALALKAEKTEDTAAPAKPAASDTTPAASTAQPTPPPPAAPPVETAAAAPAPQQPAATGQIPLPADCDLELLKEYIAESLDHIANAEASLLALEASPGGSEDINTIFRAFHTIKGTSGFLSLATIQRTAHLAESQLDRARTGQITIAGGYADLALKSCDALKAMITGLRGLNIGEIMPVPAYLDELLAQLTDPEGHGISGQAPSQNLRLGEILVGREQATPQAVEQALASQGDKPIGQVLVQSGAASVTDVAQALRTQKQADSGEGTVRINTTRLDSLLNMVGELVIAQSMVGQDPAVTNGAQPRLARNVSHAGKIVRNLQDLAMSLRMVPLKPTFQKMARLVRDLARKSNKSVQLITEGEETEIDRNMVESLNDPLVHMIRNAVDHGIEPADVRQAAGKNPTGTVTLRAFHSAGNVVIELEDDGKGLDSKKILTKAVDRGLIQAGADLSASEVFNLIFQPGFSTADKVTDVSGRGVGMDVVKRNVEAIRGRVDISSQFGQGSRFSIRLPLTMAITDAMLIRVGKEHYLLPTISILRSFRPEPGSVSTVTGQGELVKLRGELLPLFRLHRLYNVPNAQTDAREALLIEVQTAGRNYALMVDELLGQQQVVIKSLGGSMGNLPGIAGGAILGDGRVGLILDAAGIVRLAQGQVLSAAA